MLVEESSWTAGPLKMGYSGDSVDYGDKSPKQLYPIEFPNSLSPSGLPPHRLNMQCIVFIEGSCGAC